VFTPACMISLKRRGKKLFDMLSGNYDGILGLGFTTLSKTNTTTFFETLVAAPGVLEQPVFSIRELCCIKGNGKPESLADMEAADQQYIDESNQKASALMPATTTERPTRIARGSAAPAAKRQLQISNGKDPEDDPQFLAAASSQAQVLHSATVADTSTGVLLLGGIDNTKFRGDLTYLPLSFVDALQAYQSSFNGSYKAYWEAKIDGVAVNGQLAAPELQAVFDSGSADSAENLAAPHFFQDISCISPDRHLSSCSASLRCRAYTSIGFYRRGCYVLHLVRLFW
jgi:hypothetical protein